MDSRGIKGIRVYSTMSGSEDLKAGKMSLPSLKEICCRCVGQNVPFELVQLHPQRVPEELQVRIAFWSFPLSETRILYYSDFLSRCEGKDEGSESSAKDTGPLQVENMVQIGMHLSGTIRNSAPRPWSVADFASTYSVSIQFDRGHVTSTNCSCNGSKWCKHIVCLCLARIRGSVPFSVHPPLGETLSMLSREQLQKVLQHFVEVVPVSCIASLQNIVSQVKDRESEISKQPGAPGTYVCDLYM